MRSYALFARAIRWRYPSRYSPARPAVNSGQPSQVRGGTGSSSQYCDSHGHETGLPHFFGYAL